MNVLVSYLCVLLLFGLLRSRLGTSTREASGLAFLFAISPYFYGASFILLTDNLALLFVVASLYFLYPGASTRSVLVGLAAAMLAVLTRQSHIWLYALVVPVIAVSKESPRARAAILGCALVSLLPLVLLLLTWGGPFPPGFAKHEGASWDLRGPVLLLTNFGLYAGFLFPPRTDLLMRARRWELLGLLGLTLLVLALGQIGYRTGDDGYLWRVASILPRIAGTDLVFWLLFPLGAMLSVVASRRTGPMIVSGAIALVAVAAISARGGTLYQKYFDPLALLTVMLLRPRDLPVHWWHVVPGAIIGLAFAAYAVSPLREVLVQSLRHAR